MIVELQLMLVVLKLTRLSLMMQFQIHFTLLFASKLFGELLSDVYLFIKTFFSLCIFSSRVVCHQYDN